MTTSSMATRSMTGRTVATEPARNWDSLQFRFIYALSFVFYLVTAIAARFTPHFWRNAGSKHRSIFAEANEAAGNTARIAFYG